jgi:hypothetical protein
MANLLAHEWRIGLKGSQRGTKGIAKGTKKMKKILCLFAIPFVPFCDPFCTFLRSLYVITEWGRGPGGLDGRWTEAYHPLPLERRSLRQN